MTVPIVPGPGEPEPPTQPASPPPPQVVYVQAPDRSNPTKVAGNTVIVIVILVTVLCGLPLLACGAFAILGGAGSLISGH